MDILRLDMKGHSYRIGQCRRTGSYGGCTPLLCYNPSPSMFVQADCAQFCLSLVFINKESTAILIVCICCFTSEVLVSARRCTVFTPMIMLSNYLLQFLASQRDERYIISKYFEGKEQEHVILFHIICLGINCFFLMK